jgi:predicted lipoprotein with Yx(FWY)xxD motif
VHTRRRLLTSAIALFAVPVAVAAASSAAIAAPARPAQATMASHPAASHTARTSTTPVVVTTARTKFGRVLVTGSGMSLYTFSGDGLPFSATGLQLNCTALNKAANGTPCTVAWPPLLATGRLVARGGVHQKGLGSVTRNGVTQVTYFGKPVYGFINDTAAGQINGEDIAAFSGTWYLDKTSGKPAVTVPTVQTEVSPNGIVLSSPTAAGVRTVYTLTADGPNTTTCTGPCAAVWPPLLTSRPALAGTGVRHRLIGTIRRPDGTFQVTYRGHPVYFFAIDLAAGAPAGLTNGEYLIDAAAFGVWYTLLPQGTPNPGTTTVGSQTVSSKTTLSITAGFGNTTATLYAFSPDSATTSQCSGQCAVIWPPVLTTTAPAAGSGVTASLLGTIARPDGTFQVTYNGHPLYFFAKALDAGTQGAGITAFGGTFNTVNTAGAVG